MRKIAVLGSGAWGTALSIATARRGIESALWSAFEAEVREIEDARENRRRLPGNRLPELVRPTSDIGAALAGAEAVLVAIPSHVFRQAFRAVIPHLPAGVPLVSATKGIETDTLRRMSEVLEEECRGAGFPAPGIAVLSGPSFAMEVAAEMPTAIVIASRDHEVARLLQAGLSGGSVRFYTNDDVVGVEIGGAFKNVIAIAAGVVTGLGLGSNTLAALITRGLAEISRLGLAMGARPATLAGLTGMGDLVLTCTGALSRNRQVGVRLGKGETLDAILSSMDQVAEGVKTTAAVNRLAHIHGVELPIARQVEEILFGGKDPRHAIRLLMERSLKDETA